MIKKEMLGDLALLQIYFSLRASVMCLMSHTPIFFFFFFFFELMVQMSCL